MKVIELILERRMASLYHWMSVPKAESVFDEDAFNQTWKHQTKEGEFDGISLSRNDKFTYGGKAVRLTLDQGALASRYKILPLDAERAFHYSIETPAWDRMKDRRINSRHAQQYAEEFVVGKIKHLHKYITHIEISKYVRSSPGIFVNAAKKYADLWGLKLTIDPELQKRIKDDERRVEDDE